MPIKPFPQAPLPVTFEEFVAWQWQGFGPRWSTGFLERIPVLCDSMRIVGCLRRGEIWSTGSSFLSSSRRETRVIYQIAWSYAGGAREFLVVVGCGTISWSLPPAAPVPALGRRRLRREFLFLLSRAAGLYL